MDRMIQQIINEWNPLEIYPLIQSEYQYEIERIEQGMASGEQSCGNLIYSVFRDSFGLQFEKTIEECEEIACKLRNVHYKGS